MDINENLQKQINLMNNEIKYMRKLDHENIIRLKGHGHDQTLKQEGKTDEKVHFMALEPCMGGELFDFIAESGRFSDKVCRYFFKQILSALNHMHT